ncbi:threonine ammonia-lyase [Achromobacter arsenitoxydans]|uniref:Pyridoxal-5'-phosphate-dependent protein subunit beta n=1 Tax=Achromobacter arsenitoxydans SY8 TaxID=477184 RepID=H0F2D0_9BURK|nr:threonine/serine dehydratase [Achromobacter arsenitoxydans]EHK67541.1 pyridoxal-5'-phosphate-dependent protein subunit beta [Achromobacter arsenitoxydans SY8]
MNSATSSAAFAVTLGDVQQAHERIRSHIVRTPLLESASLNELAGARILVKAESLQQAGAFKFRGAVNRLLQLSDAQKRAGVVAFSSGNHALATSLVARKLGIPASIIMPADAPRAKIEGARANGAEVVLYDRQKDDREAIGAEIAGRTGAVIVPPYDDPDIMAGQGTVGLEIIEQARDMGATLDAVIAASSGGGLVAGVATAVKSLSPSTAVYAGEPEGFDELARSLASGQPESNAPGATSICDALQVVRPGKLTFPINLHLLAGSLVVSDDDVRRAMKAAYQHLRLVVEPGGAVPLAAVLARKLDLADKTVAVVLSGGNVDTSVFIEALNA